MYDKQINTIKKHLIVKDDAVFASSLDVANTFEKKHLHVLEIIRKLLNTQECPDDFGESNFRLSSYLSEQNKELPKYEMTRKGFVLLAMRFSGPKALKFQIAYIEAFDQMEKELLNMAGIKPAQGNFPKHDQPMAIATEFGTAYVNYATRMFFVNIPHNRKNYELLNRAMQKCIHFQRSLSPEERCTLKLKMALLKEKPLWANIEYYKRLGLSHVEIGKMCGCHPATIRKHVRQMEELEIIANAR